MEKLNGKLIDIGSWNENYKKKPKKYLQEKLGEALNNRVGSEANPALQKSRDETSSLHIHFDGEMKQRPVALCFDEDERMYVSTFSGVIHVVQLYFNYISLKGTIMTSVQLNSTLLYGIVSLNNVVYVSAHEDDGGIYEFVYDKDKGAAVEKIVYNCTSLCNKVHSLSTYRDNTVVFRDTGDSCIKSFNPKTKQCSVIVGREKGTRDGSDAQFFQSTGLCFDYDTLFTVDTPTGALRMTSSVTSLVAYLEHLYMFGETFGPHTRKSISMKVDISQAIERLERVYSFDKKCVGEVMTLIGTKAVTQGPQGTVSSVVMEDERRILKSLCEIKNLLSRFNPALTAKFNIKSLLTLVVENTFPEMRSGATDMPQQLEFDYRFSRAIKERLKRQCFTPFAYFTAPKSYYPQVSTTTHYKDLPKLLPPKAHKLSEKQVSEMRNWRAVYGQSVPQKTVRNMTTKDNPGTLPINLYAAESPTVQPLDFTMLSEESAAPVLQREAAATLYKLSQFVCVKADSNYSHQLFIIACLQENVYVATKRVQAKVFLQNPFNPVQFTEDAVRHVDVRKIVCALSCCNCHENLLELEEYDLILLLEALHHTAEVVTVAEAAEETAIDKEQHEPHQPTRIPRRRKRRFEGDFLYYE